MLFACRSGFSGPETLDSNCAQAGRCVAKAEPIPGEPSRHAGSTQSVPATDFTAVLAAGASAPSKPQSVRWAQSIPHRNAHSAPRHAGGCGT